MTIEIGDIVAYLRASSDKLNDDLNAAENKAKGWAGRVGDSLGGAMKTGMKIAGGLALAGLGAISAGLGVAVSEAIGAENTIAEVEAVLESTKGVAGMTKDAILSLGTSLSLVTKYGEEAVWEGESMLLTFTNIGKDVFPQATEATLNLATKFGSVENAAVMLGKALNDPTKGITALRRVGVAFTADQEKQIKALQAAGDMAGAQKIILAELETEFGGLARAAGETTAGKIEILKNRLLEVGEGIGLVLIPKALDFINKVIMPAMPAVEKLGIQVSEFLGILMYFIQSGDGSDLYTWLMDMFGEKTAGQVMDAIDKISIGFQMFLAFIQASLPIVRQVVSDVFTYIGTNILPPLVAFITGTLIPTVQLVVAWFQQNWPQISATVQAVFAIVQQVVTTVINTVVPFIVQQLGVIVGWVQTNLPLIQQTFETIVTAVSSFWATNGQAIIDTIIKVVTAAWETIKLVVSTAINLVLGIITAIMQVINGDWDTAWATIKTTLENAWNGIVAWWGTVSEMFKKDWGDILAFLQTTWETIWTGISDFVGGIWTGITDGAKGAVNSIIDELNKLIGSYNQIAGPLGLGQIAPIARLAGGTTDFGGGLAIVGEHGPEPVLLPQHAQVAPNDVFGRLVDAVDRLSKQAPSGFTLAAGAVQLNFYGPQDRESVAAGVDLGIQRARRAMGAV